MSKVRPFVPEWENAFDREFYEGLYGVSECCGEEYNQHEEVKAFIRNLLADREIGK